MKLKYYFFILCLCIILIACASLYATFHTHPRLFYLTEGFASLLLLYLWFFYHKTLRPYDTLVGGMELVKDLDLTTRLAKTGQHETDVIVHTFNELLSRLRSEHLTLEEHYTFLSLLIEASPMGIVQCSIDGNITSVNPAARQILSPFVEEAMKKLPLGQETTIRLPGEPRLFRINHLSFPDRGYQHPFYLIESLTDEVRRAEKAAYERVIRMIAHEVNNSVAGIIGSVHNEDEVGERMRSLSAFVTRIAEVVKIPKPQLQLCDLSEEVDACRPFLESLCSATQVRLEFNLTDEAAPVRLDTVLFQQVLINIVKNSIESIEKAQGLVTITTTPDRLVITDNGHGIPPEVAQNLFTPFFSTKPQGQGLGLLLIRDILTAHGCAFSLLTDPSDHLTRFTIHFPLR